MELRPLFLGKACLILGLLILAGAAFVSTLAAQTNLATIRGTVTDASGAVVPNAGTKFRSITQEDQIHPGLVIV